jgi:hypothetical protein
MVLTVSFVLSPVTGLVCHRHLRNCFRKLDTSVGRQDHTTSPSASASPVKRASASKAMFVREEEWEKRKLHDFDQAIAALAE